MADRNIAFPEVYTDRIAATLRELGTSLNDTARLADAVMRLSDHYISKPEAATPWEKDWARIAYACYFFPLNYVRVRGVLIEGARVGFFSGLSTFTDFGSGCGTLPLALADTLPGQFSEGVAIERADAPERMYGKLAGKGAPVMQWQRQAPRGDAQKRGHVSTFSFSLTELTSLPLWARASEALVLIEPGTNQDGRRLLEWRAELIAKDFHVWAPCTHAGACPLLTGSNRDWCHDRVALAAPTWFEQLSEHLPMRNPTLTCSYLLLRKSPPPAGLNNLARLTGDLRKEKGASRQMVCRGSEREFLSWQTKHGEAPAWPRGALVSLPADIVVKGKELRPLPGQGELVDAPSLG